MRVSRDVEESCVPLEMDGVPALRRVSSEAQGAELPVRPEKRMLRLEDSSDARSP